MPLAKSSSRRHIQVEFIASPVSFRGFLEIVNQVSFLYRRKVSIGASQKMRDIYPYLYEYVSLIHKYDINAHIRINKLILVHLAVVQSVF